jgi:hypothetical protein
MANRYSIVYVNGFPQEISATDRLHNSGNVTRASSAPSSPQAGDLWFDTSGDGELKVYDGSSSWDSVGGGSAAATPILENNQVISSSYSMTANMHGVSVGPLTANSGVVVTIPDGAVWVTL